MIKGLQKLAELEALPSRAPARVNGAGQRATEAETGMESVRIEANGDETHFDDLQEHQAHAADSGVENRSQLRDEGFLGHG